MRGQATVLYSMCGRQVIQGLCGALDTLASQVCQAEPLFHWLLSAMHAPHLPGTWMLALAGFMRFMHVEFGQAALRHPSSPMHCMAAEHSATPELMSSMRLPAAGSPKP